MKKVVRKGGKGAGSVRIIAGIWRGSRLPIADIPGLRPSGDRGRETLFNWLQPHLRRAVCVDLFAGSGALGMEAASRGAAHVVLIEKAALAAKILQQNADRLGAEQVDVVPGDALDWLRNQSAHSIDIAFVDPPFGLQLETGALELLHSGDLMKAGGLVYVELARSESINLPGPDWILVREKVIGEVQMLLLKKSE